MSRAAVPVQVAVPASVLPLTLAEIKQHLRITHSSDDALLTSQARMARDRVETLTGRSLVEQTLEMRLPAWPADGAIDLPRPPFLALEWVKYTDTAGTLQTLSPTAYEVEPALLSAVILRPLGVIWPSLGTVARPVQVRWRAGAPVVSGVAPDVPEDIKAAMLLLISQHFHAADGDLTHAPAVDALLAPHRTHGWI